MKFCLEGLELLSQSLRDREICSLMLSSWIIDGEGVVGEVMEEMFVAVMVCEYG